MAFVDPQADASALIILALIESLNLNIELIEMVVDFAPPEVREGANFKSIIERLEALKENRRDLITETEGVHLQ